MANREIRFTDETPSASDNTTRSSHPTEKQRLLDPRDPHGYESHTPGSYDNNPSDTRGKEKLTAEELHQQETEKLKYLDKLRLYRKQGEIERNKVSMIYAFKEAGYGGTLADANAYLNNLPESDRQAYNDFQALKQRLLRARDEQSTEKAKEAYPRGWEIYKQYRREIKGPARGEGSTYHQPSRGGSIEDMTNQLMTDPHYYNEVHKQAREWSEDPRSK